MGSVIASASVVSAVNAHDVAPDSLSIPNGEYRISALNAPELCLIAGEVGTQVQLKDCKSSNDQNWYVFYVSKLKQIYHSETQSCLAIDEKTEVIITKKCRKNSLDYAMWSISDKGQAAHISKGKSCIENKVTELKMENCHPLLITQRWTFTKSDTPQPLLLPEANLIFECYGIKPVHPNIYVKGDRCTLEKGSLSEACLKGPPERCNVELRVLVK
jgi:hypothetical protein